MLTRPGLNGEPATKRRVGLDGRDLPFTRIDWPNRRGVIATDHPPKQVRFSVPRLRSRAVTDVASSTASLRELTASEPNLTTIAWIQVAAELVDQRFACGSSLSPGCGPH